MPASTLYGLDIEVALGLARQADWATWGAGEWGVNTWGDADTELGDWVDVTCEVEDGLQLQAGIDTVDGIVTRWEAATCVFTLLGADWDPWNGPYYGYVGPQLPVRVRWRDSVGPGEWQPAFEGTVDDGGWDWQPAPPGGLNRTWVLASDYTADLANWTAPELAPAGDHETASARVTRILDLASWPTSRRAVTTGGTTLSFTTMGQAAWEMLLQVADTDLGLLWVRRDGYLVYIPRGRVSAGTALTGRLVVCVEGDDDIQVVDMGRPQPGVIRNTVAISRFSRGSGDTPVIVTRRDDASIARFRSHGYTRTDLLHDTDAWSTSVADATLGSGSWPSPAPAHVVLSSELGDVRVGPLLLSLEPDQFFDVVDTAGSVWSESVLGWDVLVRFETITGTLSLGDITPWVASAHWGSAIWGRDRWATTGGS